VGYTLGDMPAPDTESM